LRQPIFAKINLSKCCSDNPIGASDRQFKPAKAQSLEVQSLKGTVLQKHNALASQGLQAIGDKCDNQQLATGHERNVLK
jgi:hypothetical protein